MGDSSCSVFSYLQYLIVFAAMMQWSDSLLFFMREQECGTFRKGKSLIAVTPLPSSTENSFVHFSKTSAEELLRRRQPMHARNTKFLEELFATTTVYDIDAARAYELGKTIVEMDKHGDLRTVAVDHLLGSELLRYIGIDVGAAVRRLECSDRSVPFHAVRSVVRTAVSIRSCSDVRSSCSFRRLHRRSAPMALPCACSAALSELRGTRAGRRQRQSVQRPSVASYASCLSFYTRLLSMAVHVADLRRVAGVDSLLQGSNYKTPGQTWASHASVLADWLKKLKQLCELRGKQARHLGPSSASAAAFSSTAAEDAVIAAQMKDLGDFLSLYSEWCSTDAGKKATV